MATSPNFTDKSDTFGIATWWCPSSLAKVMQICPTSLWFMVDISTNIYRFCSYSSWESYSFNLLSKTCSNPPTSWMVGDHTEQIRKTHLPSGQRLHSELESGHRNNGFTHTFGDFRVCYVTNYQRVKHH